MNLPYVSGVESALCYKSLSQYQSIGLLTNDAAKTSKGVLSRVFMMEQGLYITLLFAPEHGLGLKGEDGAPQPHTLDPFTQLPVTSLYYEDAGVPPYALKNLDAVVVDIPDVGARFYTYLWSATHLMEACAADDIPVYILDRPNPLGAVLADCEGPFLDEQHCSSFIGRWNIPLKHSCTIGELAVYFQKTYMPRLNLHVIKMENYNRQIKAGFDFPFEPTSPALFRWQGVHLYPGMCLLEGLNVSEGRGTPHPFEWFGAPWLDTQQFLQSFPLQAFPQVKWIECTLQPTQGIWSGWKCNGIKVNIDEPIHHAVALGFEILKVLVACHRSELAPRPYPTLANPSGHNHLDRLTGVYHFYDLLLNNKLPATNIAAAWMDIIKPCLLYK